MAEFIAGKGDKHALILDKDELALIFDVVDNYHSGKHEGPDTALYEALIINQRHFKGGKQYRLLNKDVRANASFIEEE